MMEKMVRPFEGKQIVDIETESLMVLMKLKKCAQINLRKVTLQKRRQNQ